MHAWLCSTIAVPWAGLPLESDLSLLCGTFWSWFAHMFRKFDKCILHGVHAGICGRILFIAQSNKAVQLHTELIVCQAPLCYLIVAEKCLFQVNWNWTLKSIAYAVYKSWTGRKRSWSLFRQFPLRYPLLWHVQMSPFLQSTTALGFNRSSWWLS